MASPAQERREDERRTGERRAMGGRRDEERRRARVTTASAALWALGGALVVLYLFLLVVDAINPNRAPAATIVVLVLAVLWLGHSWRRLIAPQGHVSRPDRERRGF
jgi:hypothetical protein